MTRTKKSKKIYMAFKLS